MYARWGSFAVGMALLLAPLILGYGSAASILHDVAVGSLACIATLAALESPRARFLAAAPAVWLVAFAPATPDPRAAAADAVAGVLLLVLAAIPSAPRARRPLPRAAHDPRARAQA